MSEHQLLNDIYQNARMGMQAIPQLINMTEDTRFRDTLTSQMAEYTKISNKAAEMLKKQCDSPEDLSPMSNTCSEARQS